MGECLIVGDFLIMGDFRMMGDFGSLVIFELWVTFELWVNLELWVTFELWVNFELWLTLELQVGGQTDKPQAQRQTDTHINNMNRPDLGAWLSENQPNSLGLILKKRNLCLNT